MDETIPPCAASGVSSERMCGRMIVQQGMFAQMMTTCILWIVPLLLIVARPVHRLRALAGGCVLEVLCTVMIPVDVLVRLFWNRMSVWLKFVLLLARSAVFRRSVRIAASMIAGQRKLWYASPWRVRS